MIDLSDINQLLDDIYKSSKMTTSHDYVEECRKIKMTRILEQDFEAAAKARDMENRFKNGIYNNKAYLEGLMNTIRQPKKDSKFYSWDSITHKPNSKKFKVEILEDEK